MKWLVIAMALGAASFGAALPVFAQGANWSVAETKDAFTDRVNTSATLIEGHQGLIVSCSKPSDYDVTFVDLDGLGAIPERYILNYRFDDGDIETAQWFYTDQAARASGDGATRFLRGLVTARRVRLQAASILRGASTADFQISGISDAMSKLATVCGPVG